MTLTLLLWVGFVAALLPGALYLSNLRLYRPLPAAPSRGSPGRAHQASAGEAPCATRSSVTPSRELAGVSVLMPARNEERNIDAAIASVLSNRLSGLELIVMDDQSTDRTAERVRAWTERDGRVQLLQGAALPAGWCGKMHACYQLSRVARHELLIFMDADVRFSADAIERLVAFMEQTGADLVSGIPRQRTGTFSERLLIPLIHFVLLGFLPMGRMRRRPDPALGAGCGQLMVVRRSAYEASGGHGAAAIRATLHDGLKLPRLFRAAGYRTDLFDATEVAECRMYERDSEVWRGLGRNAHEGLASSKLILPATALLLGGQVLPFMLTPWADSGMELGLAIGGMVMAWMPRWIGVVRFKQSVLGALLHPVGVLGLVVIQWRAWWGAIHRQPAVWKERSYVGGPTACAVEYRHANPD